MNRTRLTLAALLISALACALRAEETVPAQTPQPEKKAKEGVEISGPSTRMSSNLSASITASLPKYQPPPPPPPPKTEPEPEIDEGMTSNPDGMTEVDDPDQVITDPSQPRNKILRLPKHVVQAEKPPIFKEREIYTKKGLSQLAAKRYLSEFDRGVLNKFTIPIIGMSPEQRAMMIYEEEERLQNMADLKEAAAAAATAGNKEDADFIRKQTNSSMMRSGGMDWTSRGRE